MLKECAVNISLEFHLTHGMEEEGITFIPALALHKPVFQNHAKLKNNLKKPVKETCHHLKPVKETSTVTPERQTAIKNWSIKRKNNAQSKEVQQREMEVCRDREKMLANGGDQLPKKTRVKVSRLADISNWKLNGSENLKSKSKTNVTGTYRSEVGNAVTKDSVMKGKSNCVEHETVISEQGRVDETECCEILEVYKLPDPIKIRRLTMPGKENNSDVESATEYGTDARQKVFEKTVSTVKSVSSAQLPKTNSDVTQKKHNYKCNTDFLKANSPCKDSTQSKDEVNGNTTEQVSSPQESEQKKALVSNEFPINVPLNRSKRAKKQKHPREDSDTDPVEPTKKLCMNKKVFHNKQEVGIKGGRNLNKKNMERSKDHTEQIQNSLVKNSFGKIMETTDLQLRRSKRQCKIDYSDSSPWLGPSSKKRKQGSDVRGRNPRNNVERKHSIEKVMEPDEGLQLRRSTRQCKRNYNEDSDCLQLRRSTRQCKINYNEEFENQYAENSGWLGPSSKKTKQSKIKDSSFHNTCKVKKSCIRNSTQKQESKQLDGSDSKKFDDGKLQTNIEPRLKGCSVVLKSLGKENGVNEAKQSKESERGNTEKGKNTSGKGREELGKDSDRGSRRKTNARKKRGEKQGEDSERGNTRDRKESSKEGEEKQGDDSERSNRGKNKSTSKKTLKKSGQQTKNSKKPGKKQPEVPQSSEDCKITAKKGTLKYLQQREKYVAALAREVGEDDDDFCSSNPIFAKKFKFTNLLPLSHEETLIIKTPKRGTGEDWQNDAITPRTAMLGQLEPLTPTTRPYSPYPTLDSDSKKDALKQVYQVMKNKGRRPRHFRKLLNGRDQQNINFTPLELPELPEKQSGNESETSPDEYFNDSDAEERVC